MMHQDPAVRLSLGLTPMDQSCRWLRKFASLLQRKSELTFPWTCQHEQCVGGLIKLVSSVELLGFRSHSPRNTSRSDFHSLTSTVNGTKQNGIPFCSPTKPTSSLVELGTGQVWVQRPEDAALLSQYNIERSSHAA